MKIISVSALRFFSGKRHVLNIDELSIYKGERVCVIGENGAGKTSLILAMSGLLNFEEGDIFFYDKKIGKDISKSHYLKRIAIVFQDPLLVNDSVYNNIAMVLRFRKISNNQIKERVNNVLSRLKIEHLLNRNVNSLSGGEAQRVNLARAIVLEPEILFMDEPFSAIDSSYKDNLISDLSEIIREKNITLILSTHDRYEAFRICERFIVLEKGQIVSDTDQELLLSSPCNEFSASFIGYETILNGIVESCEEGTYIAKVGNNKIFGVGEFKGGDRLIICINPENVALSVKPIKEDSSIRNCLKGVVTEINNLGYYFRVKVNCGFEIVSNITKKSFDELKIEKNSPIYVEFKAVSVHSFKK
ncbi:MAG: ABC transporter ATP-binding protein [Proteobacteria bacterium]|nr:ABC transporter ATP-binding protein [Pseudomonadota bacterium]